MLDHKKPSGNSNHGAKPGDCSLTSAPQRVKTPSLGNRYTDSSIFKQENTVCISPLFVFSSNCISACANDQLVVQLCMPFLFVSNHDRTNANCMENWLFFCVPILIFWQFASTLGLRIFYGVQFITASVSLKQLEKSTALIRIQIKITIKLIFFFGTHFPFWMW